MKVNQLYITTRKILVLVMIGLLALLTCINFFVYTEAKKTTHSVQFSLDNEEGPVEENAGSNQPDEKSPDRSQSISEEFVQEQEDITIIGLNKLVHTLLLADKKIAPVHFELITPPPDRIA